MCDDNSLAGEFRRLLSEVPVLARRLVLDTGGLPAEIPVLRGVWGRALRGLHPAAYERVFHPADRQRLPGYVLRPARESSFGRIALEWILLGQAVECEEVLLRAWDIASGMGLGADRVPFFVRERLGLGPDGRLTESATSWPLADAAWPADQGGERTPCRISFGLPVSLLREHRLILEPTLKDVVVRTCRRIGAFLPGSSQPAWEVLAGRAIVLADETACRGEWREPVALARYSAAQRQDFAVPGVCGHLDLPSGPGQLWPLLAALAWTHVGKACNLGLGQARIEPLTAEAG